MNESKLSTIAQIEDFLSVSASIEFKPTASSNGERYAHISEVLKRFDYPRRKRHERGVLRAPNLNALVCMGANEDADLAASKRQCNRAMRVHVCSESCQDW